jgi:3-oxoacyl-[acyl-carrier protein] reductase
MGPFDPLGSIEDPVKPIEDVTEAELEASFAVNAIGPFFAMQEAARVFPEGARILNISTGATRIGMAALGVYLGAKAALEQFTMVLAQEVGPKGITVNTVSAGVIETQMLDDLFNFWPQEMKPVLLERTPLR